jgi:hypothetical protein
MNAGQRIAVFTDETISPRLGIDMRGRGYDVVSCRDTGRNNLSISDEDQLTFAMSQGRAIYTFNYPDFVALDSQWHAAGRSHAGIIVSVDLNWDLAEMVRRLQRHLDIYDSNAQRDRLLILWP